MGIVREINEKWWQKIYLNILPAVRLVGWKYEAMIPSLTMQRWMQVKNPISSYYVWISWVNISTDTFQPDTHNYFLFTGHLYNQALWYFPFSPLNFNQINKCHRCERASGKVSNRLTNYSPLCLSDVLFSNSIFIDFLNHFSPTWSPMRSMYQEPSFFLDSFTLCFDCVHAFKYSSMQIFYLASML